jgi:hypothetical protein
VPTKADVLEIASGSGEHAIFLARALEVASWQPTDPDPAARASIDAWRSSADEAASAAVRPAMALDVTSEPWPALAIRPNVITCVNMVHIAPWIACEALLRGASRTLPSAGLLYLYGPYKRAGRHTAPSNEAFDESLRSRNPEWGVRDLDDVTRVAAAAALDLVDVIEMPANNLSVLFRRAPA